MANKKKVIGDVALNVVATALPLCVLQLIILPLMAQDMQSDEYGLVVTTLSIYSVLPDVFGTVLNNIRLILNNRYILEGEKGDFNLLLCVIGLSCAALCVVAVQIIGTVSTASIILFFLASIIWISRSYYLVAFRLIIDYKSILICNLVQLLGYFFGYLLFKLTNQWVFVYLTGQGLSLIYIFAKSDLHKEPIKPTKLFKKTASDVAALSVSQFLTKFMSYSDRILLYPVIGGSAVSVYYVSTLVGKIVSMAVNPINGVMLTYLSKGRRKSNKAFRLTMFSGFLVCAISYALILFFGRPVLGLLYPNYVNEAMAYLPITSITALLYVLISVAQPFTLKYYSMKWQIIINGGTGLVYVLLGMLLLNEYGLMGFCVGALVANAAKLLIMLGVNVLLSPDSKSL